MEPAETTPSHCPRGGEGKVGADEREDVGHSCADSCDSSTGLEQSSAATQQLGCSSARPGKQARPACSVHPDQDGSRDADVLVHVLNLFPDGGQTSGKLTSCPVPGPSPTLETGDQAAHAWCCSFTPPGGAEELDPKGCEPRPGRTMDLHCDKRASSLAPPTQDHRRCQDAEDTEESEFGAERWSADSQRSGRLQDASGSKGQQESLPALSQTFSLHDSVSEDLASSFDDLSVECLSADWEPNVSSLGSESQTDWDQTDQEEEEEEGGEVENYCYSDSFISAADYCSCSASQESSATSEPPHSAAAAEGSVLILGTLPPSDSFADFCTAPTQGSEEGQWAEFSHQGAQVQTASPSCQVQQLLLDSFPEEEHSSEKEEEGEGEEVLSLGRHLPDSQKMEETQHLRPTFHSIQKGMWWLQQDPHSADGVKFHWGGSQSNRSLLRCLGVEAENTGILEPTKDSTPAVCSPEHKAHAANTPPESQDARAPATDAVQVALSSSQPDWSSSSSRGLSSSTQVGTSPRRVPHFWGWK